MPIKFRKLNSAIKLLVSIALIFLSASAGRTQLSVPTKREVPGHFCYSETPEATPEVKATSSSKTSSSVDDLNLGHDLTPQSNKDFPNLRYAGIPFEYDPPALNEMLVQVSVNGSKPMTFTVDSGVSVGITVFPWAAKEAGLKLTDNAIEMEGTKEKFRLSEPLTIEMKSAVGKELELKLDSSCVGNIPLIQQSSNRKIAGVLGGGILLGGTSRIDFDRHLIYFVLDSHSPLPIHPDGVTLPLDRDEAHEPYISGTLPGTKPISFLIDTGAESTEIPKADAKDVSPIDTYPIDSTNITRTYKTEVALVPDLQLGAHHERMASITLDSDRTFGRVGMEFLSQFRATFDRRNGILTLEPRPNYYRQSPAAPLIWAKKDKDLWRVYGIERARPDAKAVSLGDTLLSIDGLDVASMEEREIKGRLSGVEGTTARLVFKNSSGDSYTVTYLRANAFPKVIVLSLGMTLLKEEGAFARIVFVEPGSEVDKAGFKKDQFLTEVNGKSTRVMSRNTLLQELQTANVKAMIVKTSPLEIK